MHRAGVQSNSKCAKLEGRAGMGHSQTRKASSTKRRGGKSCSERRAGVAKHGSPVRGYGFGPAREYEFSST